MNEMVECLGFPSIIQDGGKSVERYMGQDWPQIVGSWVMIKNSFCLLLSVFKSFHNNNLKK